MKNCIFCKIIAGESPSEMLYQDDQVTAFCSNNPMAPTHVLIVPNNHIGSISEIGEEDEKLVGHLFTIANQIAEQAGIHKNGYRLIINNGPHGGQVIYHLHLHLIGGRRMRHPMG